MTILFEFGGLSSLNVLNEPGPTFETVLTGKYELSIGEDRIPNCLSVFAQPVNRRRITVV
jgi:hypothetical protein